MRAGQKGGVERTSEAEERFGAYVLQSEIDSGVATTVWRARHVALAREAVVKRLKSVVASDSAFAFALEREAKILADVSHPHIVALYDFVKNESQMGVVLEHVEGFRLDAVREASGGHVRLDEAAAIGAGLADALAHLHARGIVHRDVKPSNVLLGKNGELKLLDFGGAAYVGESDVRASSPDGELAFGTPAYLAPEQLFGAEADPKSDVFSLGVALYELATGARPFDGRASRSNVTPLERRAPELDRRFTQAVDASLAKLPADRPTAEELAAILRECAGELTVLRAVRGLLARSHLAEGAALSAPRIVAPRASRARYFVPIGVAVALAFVLVVAFSLRRAPRRDAARAAAPAEVGELRVLASPWAEVWLDGKLVETTPFARPLVVPAGPHRVTLRHPEALDVMRDVTIAAGTPVMVDVEMALRGDVYATDAGGGG